MNQNIIIRNGIVSYVNINGPTETRTIIRIFTNRFNKTKQCISGNVSFMVCKANTLSIIKNRPNSILY